jgi:hypothetical protein
MRWLMKQKKVEKVGLVDWLLCLPVCWGMHEVFTINWRGAMHSSSWLVNCKINCGGLFSSLWYCTWCVPRPPPLSTTISVQCLQAVSTCGNWRHSEGDRRDQELHVAGRNQIQIQSLPTNGVLYFLFCGTDPHYCTYSICGPKKIFHL